ncbi:hypothetical protein MAPG_11467 [Magnaporthiopsis poae ATCC 64411]|uniref:Protein CAP22 n=1 Tax=Magnaporthiopsis poae (strain ATCC 64411 / 73-15) TaxID=644358 RepID=A0A0C4EFC4_MAGP6|nr:hypothetical protein MAPG_11467 [Magnaporthiopsis poae ATCC 64411]
MHFNNAVLVVLATLAPVLVRAEDDMELDRDDIPQVCRGICEPMRALTDLCDVDDDRINNDRIEELLNLQCVCTNRSFDVARFAALCHSCMTQNTRNNDDHLKDINEIMRKCGFPAQNFLPSQANDANGIHVVATRPNSANQLTTTYIAPGSAATAPPYNNGNNNGNYNGNNGNNPNYNNGNGQQQPGGAFGSNRPNGATSAAIPMVGLALAAVFGTALLL